MSDARLAAALFAVAVLFRVVTCLGTTIFGTDSASFMFMADFMHAGRFHDALAMAYHPLYPLLIAMGRMVTGSSETAGYAISILLGAAATVPLFLLVKEVFGRPAAFLTCLLYVFQRRIVEVQSDIMTDATFMFFAVSSLWLTWRLAGKPSLEGAAVAGLAAAAAYLTRPEGMLFIVVAAVWPAAEWVLRRNFRVLGIQAVLVVVVLTVSFPYLLWIKSMRGGWAASFRPSAQSAERAMRLEHVDRDDSNAGSQSLPRLNQKYAAGLLRLNLYGALFPFYVLGIMTLRREDWRKALPFLLVPLIYLAAVFHTLQRHNAMSDRYVTVPLVLLWPLAAVGMVRAVRWSSSRWPEVRWRPAAVGALVVAITVLPNVRLLAPRKQECRSYAAAAQWIRDQGGEPRPMISSVSQVSYLAGCRELPLPDKRSALVDLIREHQVRYVLYSERDVDSRPSQIAEFRSCDLLGDAFQVPAPEGTEKIYIHRVR